MMGINEFGKSVTRMMKHLNGEGDTLYSFRNDYQKCVLAFSDREGNLKRWLLNKPCLGEDRLTGCVTEVEIGRDVEALYYYLLLRYKQNHGLTLDEEFLDYVDLLIKRSKMRCDGD